MPRPPYDASSAAWVDDFPDPGPEIDHKLQQLQEYADGLSTAIRERDLREALETLYHLTEEIGLIAYVSDHNL